MTGPAALALALALAAPPPGPAAPGVKATHLFDAAGATGTLSSTWARLAYDAEHKELFVAAEGSVRVFNESGMEIHRFADDGDLGTVLDVAILPDGQLVTLSNVDGRRTLLRADFRGKRIGPFELRGLPPELAKLSPDVIVHRGDALYLAETGTGRVVVVDERGAYRRSVELYKVLALDPKRRADSEITGLAVAPNGDLVVALPMLFRVFVVSPSGSVTGFGTRGSTPGKFNVIGAVAVDERQNLFLTDRLRSVVMCFGKDLVFVGEWGYRGDERTNLVAPFSLVASGDRVFVAQAGGRGVRAFRVALPGDEPAEPAAPAPPAASGAAGAGP
jgi:DNA-binding beta-propeller fold protein YncE